MRLRIRLLLAAVILMGISGCDEGCSIEISNDNRMCQEQIGGTGKTSGWTEKYTGTLHGEDGRIVRCVDGEAE